MFDLSMFKGVFLLLVILFFFSLFSFKAPKGKKAMSGLANAAIVTFLVEAFYRYIFGDTLGIPFLFEVGKTVGGMGGVAAASLVMLGLGANPIFCVAVGISLSGMGILEGFVVGYIFSFVADFLDKHLPKDINVIFIVLIIAPLSRLLGTFIQPFVTMLLNNIGGIIVVASENSPIFMGLLLGGIIKVICTSPLSSMALTALLGLTGLPMGIACVACFGGAFANGITFYRLRLGNKSKLISLMIEPLTQADIVSTNPVPLFSSSFLGGALAGLSAGYFNIISNAPGTASPVPGLLTPFAFNPIHTLIPALICAMLGGCLGGLTISTIFMKIKAKKMKKIKNMEKAKI